VINNSVSILQEAWYTDKEFSTYNSIYMDIQKSAKQAFEIVKLQEPVMNTVAADKTALQPALMMVVAAAVVGALGSYLFPISYGMVTYRLDAAAFLIEIIFSAIIAVGGLYLGGFLSEKVFHSKLGMEGFVRVMGYAALVNFLGIYPRLSLISGIWSLVILCFVLTKLGKLSAGSIILFIILQIVIVGVVGGLLGEGAWIPFMR